MQMLMKKKLANYKQQNQNAHKHAKKIPFFYTNISKENTRKLNKNNSKNRKSKSKKFHGSDTKNLFNRLIFYRFRK